MLPSRPSRNTTWMGPAPSDPSSLAEAKRRLYADSPLHPAGDLLAWRSTVLFAPHPDDESLGCGGLIATLCDLGRPVAIVFVSDGAMSHPNSQQYPRAARIELREKEALTACGILGVPSDRVTFLRLPDGAVPGRGEPGFTDAVATVRQSLDRWRADTVVVPWRRDLHEDHRATWSICREATTYLSEAVRWIEYPVWMWEAREAADLPAPSEMVVWRLDVADVLERKQRAVQAHASQYAGLIDDDPTGFQLQAGMLDHFRRPTEVFFEPGRKRDRSLGGAYFEAVYRERDDPWNFATSPYEKEKYAATLAALPAERYRSGFEIGCSIGVLTEMLAERCDLLLAVDLSERALAIAGERLANHDHVHLARLRLPQQFPAADYDLIILSEVGYYWSYADLDTAIAKISAAMRAGGTLILVHYTPYVPDYPLTGDEVHEAFNQQLTGFHHLRGSRADRYRLDVWTKRG